ncbi:MAG: sugar ABC transporter permease [Actinomycetota bacterium]|nr:sugar ABC transporter permease [Actinomycetota bacterium]
MARVAERQQPPVAAALTAPASPGRRHLPLLRRHGAAYLMLLPAFAVIGGLVFYPLVLSVWDSLHVDNLLVPSHAFTGASNYTGVLTDSSFLHAALNTVWYLALTTVLSLVVGTAMAMFLHNVKHFRAILLAIIVLPWAVPGTVSGDLWSLIFNPQTGLLDGLLVGLHIVSYPILWMGGNISARVAISVTLVWQVAPITAVIVLAGLESIPPTLFEQAAVDGATGHRRFTRITLPLLRPALAIGLLEATVLGIGAFDQIVVLNGYSPGTLSAVEQLYLYAFQDFNFGYGIAASMVVTVATLLVSVFYLKGLYREVSY